MEKEGGGFAWVHWAGSPEDEEAMAAKYKTSIRNIPLDGQAPAGAEGDGKCIFTGYPRPPGFGSVGGRHDRSDRVVQSRPPHPHPTRD